MGFWHTTGYVDWTTGSTMPAGYCYGPGHRPPVPTMGPAPEQQCAPESIYSPAMYVRGQEVGHRPLVITDSVGLGDIQLHHCNSVALNGRDITVREVPKRLSSMTHGLATLDLFGAESSRKTVSLDFQIAVKGDLDVIDAAFEAMRKRNQLDICAINLFISETRQSETALSYCGGIADYLYGVIAKERHRRSDLKYESYQSRFGSAASKLSRYDRPIARAIIDLISFHFNHFSDTSNCHRITRVAIASRIFQAWMARENDGQSRKQVFDQQPHALEESLADFETECILRWTCWPEYRKRYLNSIESHLSSRTLAQYDVTKLHILLAEEYVKVGNRKSAIEHAKELSNITEFAPWAASIIDRASSSRMQKGE